MRLSKLAKTETFAGFAWPRYRATLPVNSLAARLAEYKRFKATNRGVDINALRITDYYFYAGDGAPTGNMFYAGENDPLPWVWCDTVNARIGHRGWYTDDDGMGETLRGIVLTLPNRRGYLAGWSIGEGMLSSYEYEIYDDDYDAARAADRLAEIAAEKERDYQAQEREAEALETLSQLENMEA